MGKKWHTLSVFLLMVLTSVSYGQKREIERAVASSEVPESARNWLETAYQGHGKTKWYFQTDGEKEVYEAKLKWKRNWHSVEFTPEGDIRNVEILIRTRDLDQEVRVNMFRYLSGEYSSFKIDRLQIHYTGSSSALRDLIAGDNTGPELVREYEVEFVGRKNGVSTLWEGQFDKSGNFMEKRKIELSSTDVLDF